MFLKTARTIATTFAVGGVLALTQLGAPTVATVSPAIKAVADCTYGAKVVTSTDLTLDRSTVRPGESNTARATVSSDAETPRGSVTFKVSGHSKSTVTLTGGEASYAMPTDLRAGKTYQVTAKYNGKNCFRKSSDSANVTVEKRGGGNGNGNGGGEVGGQDGTGGSGGPGNPGNAAGNDASSALPDTGLSENMGLYGLLGLGLLGAGGLSLLVHRRRARN